MFFVIITDEGVGIYDDCQLVINWYQRGIIPAQCKIFHDVDTYIRSKLSFDQLYDLGWEDEILPEFINHFHSVSAYNLYLQVLKNGK